MYPSFVVRVVCSSVFMCLFLWHVSVVCLAREGVPQILDRAYAFEQEHAFDQAIACYRQALAHDQDKASLLFSIARCYYMSGHYEEASRFFLQASVHAPGCKNLLLNANMAICKLGRFDQSINILERGLTLFPDDQELTFQLQWRLMQAQELSAMGVRWPTYKDCCWQQRDVRGKRILLPLLEAGAGDIFMFMRGAQWLHNAGAYVIVQTWPRFLPILRLCPCVDEVITNDETALSDATYTMGWSSYCYFMDQLLHNPAMAAEPYLCADPVLIDRWREHCASDNNIKIGLCWLSSFVTDSLDRRTLSPRAIPPRELEPLADVQGVSFYSLQHSFEPAYAPPAFVKTFDTFDSVAFMDTAALIKNCDLVLTVDTSIAHLAGALGARVWLLLNVESDVRWFLDRDDSPWYPTMRIFRQQRLGDWESVIAEVMEALALFKQGL